MSKALVLISIALVIFSCKGNDGIKEDIRILHSKNIIIYDNVTIIVGGKDTLMSDHMDSEFKLVVYTDSTECNSCEIQKMYAWNSLLRYAERFDSRLKYYFIFSPKRNDEYSVRLALRNALFDYPVILDSKGEFAKLNPHLPKNKALHTFLLDKENNVILVGSPLNNPEIEKLFKETVEKHLGK